MNYDEIAGAQVPELGADASVDDSAEQWPDWVDCWRVELGAPLCWGEQIPAHVVSDPDQAGLDAWIEIPL